MIFPRHQTPRRAGETWSGNPLSWKDSESRTWNVVLEWEKAEGAPRPIGISLSLTSGEGTLNSALLRELPIGTLARFDLQHKSPKPQKDSWSSIGLEKSRGPRRGHALEPELLKVVARLYEEALMSGQKPSQAIARQLNISPSTAAKRIMAARKQKFLGPAIPGKKGEAI